MLDRSERNVKDGKYGNRRVGIDACFSKMQHFPHWSNFLLKLKCDERHGFSSCGHLFAPPGGLYVSIPTTGPVLRRLKASWSSDSWVPMGWTLDNQLNWKQPKQLDATCGSVPTYPLTSVPTHQPTHLPTHQCNHSPSLFSFFTLAVTLSSLLQNKYMISEILHRYMFFFSSRLFPRILIPECFRSWVEHLFTCSFLQPTKCPTFDLKNLFTHLKLEFP